jgi:hypothetical protein
MVDDTKALERAAEILTGEFPYCPGEKDKNWQETRCGEFCDADDSCDASGCAMAYLRRDEEPTP